MTASAGGLLMLLMLLMLLLNKLGKEDLVDNININVVLDSDIGLNDISLVNTSVMITFSANKEIATLKGFR